MCTAYEIGKKGNRQPARSTPAMAACLDDLAGLHIVRPTLMAPVMMPDGSPRNMSWGFRRTFKGKSGKRITRTIVNSREDKLGSVTWREAFLERRCVIPAATFYEWIESPDGKSIPLRFSRRDDEMTWIAGIWEDGENGECFSMITTEPNKVVLPVHDRMPAALSDEQIEPYLDRELNEFGPSGVEFRYSQAANFLTTKHRKKPSKDQEFPF